MISVTGLVHAIVMIVIVGLIVWLLWFLLDYCKIPEPFNRVARILLMVVCVLFLIGVLLTLAGVQVLTW